MNPFVLTTGRMLHMFHTDTMTGRSKSIQRKGHKPFVSISPEDAERLGLSDGDMVRVTSRHGSIIGRSVGTSKGMMLKSSG